MSPDFTLPQLDERVLSTLNCDGSRRWLSPREVRGSFWTSRFVVAWSLIVVFTVLPWFRIAGKPPLVLDVMLRQFTFFGTTFRPTETLLLALLILSIFVAVFLLTAIYGRVWCGWACQMMAFKSVSGICSSAYRRIVRVVAMTFKASGEPSVNI